MARIAIRLWPIEYRDSAPFVWRLVLVENFIDVEMVHGHYGEFKGVVDGNTVVDGGTAAFLGALQSASEIVAAVRDRLKL